MIKSLYVHIPFCLKKCLYCDFNSYANIELQDSYIDALIKEIGRIKINKFETVFIGGGTPTILSIKNLEKLMKAINKFDYGEYTFESNPGTINENTLKLMHEYGANRLSIGLQAWQNRLLKGLGRIHSIDDFLIGYETARKVGFKNINVDLMFGIPDQTMEDWVETIDNVIRIKPDHISCYSLIIEEGTPFYELYNNNKLNLVEEEIERDMYHYAISSLQSAGYDHYEISNFAKPGFECRHNITYWKQYEYIGVGAGAHSFLGGKRFHNSSGIKLYIKGIEENNITEDEITLTLNDEISEYMFLGLRMMEGISRNEFKEKFNTTIDAVYNEEISDLVRKVLLLDDGENIKLTDKGIDFSNQVFVQLLL
jgi:oxygen-independent coproporphyrinogen-3 oxidase